MQQTADIRIKKGQNEDGSYDCNMVKKICTYSAKGGGFTYCDYLCKMGHSRGGDPSHCHVFKPS